MAVYNLNMADEKLIDETIEVDQLVSHVPRLENFFDGIQEMASMQAEISKIGEVTKRSGFTPDMRMQRIATIPYSVAHTIQEVDPEFWKDKAKVYRFLARHPEYDTRRTLR